MTLAHRLDHSPREGLTRARVDVGRVSHAVQFYVDESPLQEAVGVYLAEGMAAGAPALVIAGADRRRAFERHLRGQGVNPDRARERGQLAFRDPRELLETIMRGGAPDRTRFSECIEGLMRTGQARNESGGAMRVYGEMVDLLCQEGRHDAALALEEQWNEVANTWPLRLLCAYSLRGFTKASDSAVFDDLCGAHTHVVPAHPSIDGGVGIGRQRELARLQQRAFALENEVRRREVLEVALRRRVDEQHGIEARLRLQQQRLEEADRSKDAFLAMLAHELRNPLAPITTTLELLRMRMDGDESIARPLDILTRQTDHLSRLVDDLLEVSRITSGRIRLEMEPLDAASAVHRAVEISRPLMDARHHRLTLVLPHQQLWLMADATRLVQVLGNLLNNAAKYSDEGGAIRLSLEADGEEVVFRVRDQGIGIAADLLPKLFDLFTQGERSLDRSQGGLGLGLTLVRSLVRLHGGSVTAHSAGPGQGSEFVVRLPGLPHSPYVPDASDGLTRLSRVAARRIVVVDDNLDAADSLAALLSMTGHDVRVAYDGPSAIAAVRDHRPDVVLLDIGLPRMDGYEVARQLRRENGHRVRLFALTGYGQAEDRRRSQEAGFDQHFVKPLDLHVLSAALAGSRG